MAETSPGTSAGRLEMSGRSAHSSRLWIDNNGKRLPIVYTYDSSFSEDYMFQDVIKFWADNTCLNFKREKQSRCAAKHSTPAISLYSYGYSTVHRGIDQSESCTLMSLGAGYWDFVHMLLMNVLGMLPYLYRNDSALHLNMNVENLKAYIKADEQSLKAYLAPYQQCHGHTQVLPTPFDFLSKQMPFSTELGNLIETRPVYVTRDPRYQYLLDHHATASLAPTFYDVLVINSLYKCPAEWAAACAGAVPSCKNHGYLMKTCRCRCPPGFSGDTCQTKSGPMFPLQPAAFELTVTMGKTYDFASLNLKTVDIADADPNFVYYLFIVIRIAPTKSTHLPSISLVLPFAQVGPTLVPLTDKLLRFLASADCLAGLRLLWGSGSRLACDCFSSLVTNEPPSEARVFRGRRPQMAMTLINNLGRTFKRPDLTVQTSQFRLTAEFRPPPTFSVADTPDSKPVVVDTGGASGAGGVGGASDGGGVDVAREAGGVGGVGGAVNGSSGGGNSTDADGVIGEGSTASALIGSLGGLPELGMLGVVGPLALLVLLCLLLLMCCRRRRGKPEVLDELSEEEEGSSSESDESDD